MNTTAIGTTGVGRSARMERGAMPLHGLVASTRAELLRLRKWPAFWVLLGTWILLNLVFAYLFNYLAYTTGESSRMSNGLPKDALLQQLLPAAVPEVYTQGMAMFGGALMLILGALATGSGFGWGTWKSSFTQGPSRAAAIGATLLSLLAVVVGLVGVAFLIDTGVAALIGTLQSQPLTFPAPSQVLLGLGVGIVILGMWTLAGAFVGAIARGPALAIGLGLVWVLVVETLLRGVAGLLGPISVITDHLPGTAAGSLAGSMRTTDGAATPGVLDILSRTESVVVLVCYAVVFAACTIWLLGRRDLS